MGHMTLLKLKIGTLLFGKGRPSDDQTLLRMKLGTAANLGLGLGACSSGLSLQLCSSLPAGRPPARKGAVSLTSRKSKASSLASSAFGVPWWGVSSDTTKVVKEHMGAELLKQDPLKSIVENKELPREGTTSVYEQYVFEEEIGKGTYGTVYSAVEVATGMRVAIKKVPSGGQERRSSFSKARKEAEVMKSLQDCTSAVQYRAFFENEDDELEGGQDRKVSFIVMEHCGGGDLHTFVEEHGPLGEEHAAFAAYEILNLIQECHMSRILHGDVKSGNFAIASDHHGEVFLKNPRMLRSGWLKGIDFGTCTEVGMGKVTTKVGTPTHWAPEVFASSYKMEADMWSMGVLLYQMMSGRLPFCDKEEQKSVKSDNDILHMVFKRAPDFSYGPWLTCSPQLLDFIKGLLMKDSQTRMTASEGLEHPWIRLHLNWQGSEQYCSGNDSEDVSAWISCFNT